MQDDDNHDTETPRHDGKTHRRSSSASNLIERFLSDVSIWLENGGTGTAAPWASGGQRPGTSRRRNPEGQARHNARDYASAEDFSDVVGGSVIAQRAQTEGDYDDEEDPAHSKRNRGPKGYRRSDERVAEVVNDALYDDDLVDASDIEVSVSDGDVRLSGSVGSRRHKHRAENLAARVSGVLDVDNGLRVTPRDGAGAQASRE